MMIDNDLLDAAFSNLPSDAMGRISDEEMTKLLTEVFKKLPNGLTDDEEAVMNNLIDAWNNFLKLPNQHPDDVNDFRNGIHICQRMILCRPTRRMMK